MGEIVDELEALGRKFRFVLVEREERYCLKSFKVTPLSPIEAELLSVELGGTLAWNYGDESVEFWPREEMCRRDRAELEFALILLVLKVAGGLRPEIELVREIVRSTGEWISYSREGEAYFKGVLDIRGAPANLTLRISKTEEGLYDFRVELRALPLSSKEAEALGKFLELEGLVVESRYPILVATKEERGLNPETLLAVACKIPERLTK